MRLLPKIHHRLISPPTQTRTNGSTVEKTVKNIHKSVYQDLINLETKYRVGIVSIILAEKESKNKWLAFELHGKISLDLLINPTYKTFGNDAFSKELIAILKKHNLSLVQLIVSQETSIDNI